MVSTPHRLAILPTVRLATAFLADLAAILLFVGVGRAIHDDASGSFVRAALPFVGGLLLGWVVGIVRNFQTRSVMFGVMVWGATLFFGMAIRSVLRDGTDIAFVLVTAAALGVLLVGWRAAFSMTR